MLRKKDMPGMRTPSTAEFRKALAASTILVSIALTIGGPVLAEEERQGILGEIVVTAQKRSQLLQDVPMSISALSEHALERLGAAQFEDFARTVPSLSFLSGGTGRQKLVIRGLSTQGGSAPTVSYYLDETPLSAQSGTSRSVTVDPRLFDIDRVEILRGPQGTLYGSSSMGGTVRLISSKPDAKEFAAKVDGTLSTTKHGGENYGLNAMVNLPIIEDKLAVRAVGYYHDESGFIDRYFGDFPIDNDPATFPDYKNQTTAFPVHKNVNDQTTRGARLAVQFQPTENLTITPSVYAQRTKMSGSPTYDDPPGAGDLGQFRTRDVAEPYNDKWTLYNLTAKYQFGDWAELTSSSSYFDRKSVQAEDVTDMLEFFIPFGIFIPAPIVETLPIKEFTQEIRLTSTNGGRLEWIIGGYYNDNEDKWMDDLFVPGWSDAAGGWSDFFGPDIEENNFFLGRTDRTSKQYALFADATFHLTPQWALSGGLRWFDLKSTFVRFASGVFNGGSSLTVGDSSETGTTFRVLTSYEATDDILLYATVSKGFRPGGPNTGVPLAVCADDLAELGLAEGPSQFNADSVINYEAGAKTRLANGRVTLNSALYYIDWKDVQQLNFLDCGFRFTDNAGSAVSKGIELEVNAQVTERLQVSAGFGYNDATLSADAPSLDGVDGDRLQDVPKWTASASADYTFPAFNGNEGFIHGNIQYAGNAIASFDETNPDDRRPSYTLVNARLGLRADSWEAAFFINNLFNKQASLGITDSLGAPIPGLLRVTTNRPRTIGVNVKKTF